MENMVNHTDEQLITLVGQGNEMAFTTLYERYRSQVFMYILTLTKDETLADDFSQETYIKVLTSLREGRYEHDEKYLGWVKRIAHNIIFDYFRKQQARNAYYTDVSIDDMDLSTIAEIADTSVEEAQKREEILSAVEERVGVLPAEQVTVVRLHYWEGMSFKEIAAQQNISINTALGRMHYAVSNLRKMLIQKIA